MFPVMDWIDLLQWPAMAITVLAAWLVAALRKRNRSIGFWCFLVSNVLWVAWGLHDGATALVALHDLNLAAAYCDHVILLDRGRVVAAGAVADVLVPSVIDPVYGVTTMVLRHPATGRPVLTFQPGTTDATAAFQPSVPKA